MASEQAPKPLFFNDPHPISKDRHGNAGLNKLDHVSFAAKTNSIPLNIVEFFDACKHFPIVFTTGEQPTPVALVGIEDSHNYFVGDKGEWQQDTYLPAYIRKYPFILMEDQAADRWILCVDEKAPNYAAKGADMPFFTDAGESSEMTDNALKFSTSYQQQHNMTLEYCRALKENGLLSEKTSTLNLPDGSTMSLGGFAVIDEKAFANLPDNTFLEWRKRGWTAVTDAVLISGTNWRQLGVMAGRYKMKKAG